MNLIFESLSEREWLHTNVMDDIIAVVSVGSYAAFRSTSEACFYDFGPHKYVNKVISV